MSRLLYDLKAAAEQVGRSEKYLRNEIKAGRLVARRLADGVPNSPYMVRHEDLDAWTRGLPLA